MGKRPVIIPSVAIAVVAVGALTIPAFADDGGDESPRGNGGLPAGKAIVAPQTLAALQRDLGLTEDQARARVRKDQWGRRTDRALRTAVGDAYAGAWMNTEGTQMTVAVTTAAAAERVRATGAEPKVVARSAKALDTVKTRLDTVARGNASAISGVFVAVSSNTVTVVARQGKEAVANNAVARAGVPKDAVTVVSSAAQPKPLFDLRGGDAYFINSQFRCSIGFSVQGGFVTAGHCGAVGDTTTGQDGNGQQVAQGTVRASSFPGDDWGFVETNAQWTPLAVVATTGGTGLVPVAGSEEAPVGSAICRTGSTTGTRCGRVEAKNATVNYPEGTVTGLTRTDVCAEGGDSGGSWISGNQAQGVTSGGSGNCTVGGETFFQPITEILQRNNLTLVTDGTAPEEPADPQEPEEPAAPANCAGHEASVNGTIGRTGERQRTQFFRANAGTHTACLAGPNGTDFDVALQRWNGRAWQTVADANNATSSDTLTFTGPAGNYRYQIRSQSGTGSYVLGVDIP